MTEEEHICPYTGLRSFTEEESLYFKGRDAQIDQISKLLERNKFLMVTGASGEGKSSLIFAGLIPNARAGFFRAKYNNWVVANFRPERSPVRNMAAAVSKAIGSPAATAETELRRGFSSLIDLYTNSDLYIDEHDEKWTTLPEETRKGRKRSAANLLILVDQFEEFFTNPENFHNGAPSQDSQIAVNVLLETARIALNNHLPVYVVCTMRSDYIGQCSAFRDLPEYIGFSQFFVPRLKRKELKQIIEEPAILSGNRISQRLVERLVYDLAEGLDQLPILQHALTQVWLAASHGKEEMDLIHYAKVGGMPAHELPAEDQPGFAAWFQTLPEYQRNFYREPGLERVIELHANRLYEGAWEYYNAHHPDHPITQRDAKNIIALTFACLTRIDNSRAVRNRMTLGEITQILNRPALNEQVVGGVLNLFREESNSFIRPFKTEEPATQELRSDSVLDITHESLIRNWGRLNKWANQEFEFYTTFLDFKKQLDRWVQSGKSRDYLLPIGPLSFFESWYAQCKPNARWIFRYTNSTVEGSTLEKSERLLRDMQEFLRRSARKVIITRTFMKYGANRIAAMVAIALMLFMSAFYWYDADQKKNSRVVHRVLAAGQRLLKSDEIDLGTKATYLISEERYEPGKIIEYLRNQKDRRVRLTLASEIYSGLLEISRRLDRPVRLDVIHFISEEIRSFPHNDLNFLIQNQNKFIALLAYDNYFNSQPETQKVITLNAMALRSLLMEAYGGGLKNEAGLAYALNLGVHLWLTFGQAEQGQVAELIRLISPFSGAQGKIAFDTYYKKGNLEANYEFNLDYAGGYHTLASLYAALGDVKSILACFEKETSAQVYFRDGYSFNNYANVLGYLYSFHHEDLVGDAVRWVASHAGTSETETFAGIVNQTGYLKYYSHVNVIPEFMRSFRGIFDPNLTYLDGEVLDRILNDYEKTILKVTPSPEREFLMAIALKQRAMVKHKYNFDRGFSQDTVQLKTWLAQSFRYFEAVPETFLGQQVNLKYRYYSDGKRVRHLTRRQWYLYPDHMGGWLNNVYHSDLFFNFISRRGRLSDLYRTTDDLNLMTYWLANAHELFPRNFESSVKNDYVLPERVIERLVEIVKSHPNGNQVDLNLAYMILANRFFSRNEEEKAMNYYKAINTGNIYGTANTYEYLTKTFTYNQLKDLSSNLMRTGHPDEAILLAERFEKPNFVIHSYILDAQQLYFRDYDPRTFVLLDSALIKIKRIQLSEEDLSDEYRLRFLFLLGNIGGDKVEAGARDMMKEMNQNSKSMGNLMWIWGLANQGNYYKAMTAVPPSFTDTEEMISLIVILNQEARRKEHAGEAMPWNEVDTNLYQNFEYINYEPF